MAGWVHGGEPGAGFGAGSAEELLRLRDVYADSGGGDSGAGGSAGMRHGNSGQLSAAARLSGERAQQSGLGDRLTEGNDVCVGADSGAMAASWIAGIFD